MDCPKCGVPVADHKHLTRDEFEEVTKAFIERLSNAMSNAGCNDLFESEFPKSVCRKFPNDQALLESWEAFLLSQGRGFEPPF